ncbi:MAG: phosphoribosylanthranilate isomerase [Polyangiales bacterium]
MHVKICGITSIEDGLAAVEAGASAIGLNFVPASPRCLGVDEARTIATALTGRCLVVGVVADLAIDALQALVAQAHLGCLQLHGDESPQTLQAMLPHAYKALRVGDARDVARAAEYPGEHLLVDARVAGVLGGSGVRVDPRLVAPLARTRKLTLAGGLTPDNVAAAIAAVGPYCVDVASGVERHGDPRRKDAAAMRAFVEAARAARSPFLTVDPPASTVVDEEVGTRRGPQNPS